MIQLSNISFMFCGLPHLMTFATCYLSSLSALGGLIMALPNYQVGRREAESVNTALIKVFDVNLCRHEVFGSDQSVYLELAS
ncbi:LOW QUALITY PROTEIN: hypothetical protein TorRG33x02_176190 [Trema orientale]|uniref:Uncharacterized protein n=1 Tax=Trema orientale TaxID=63057 RepID=A0A2P5EM02_TREOI|nr:LOW QUALITY PROTEIN: hypothetical protein TorRG33x02_176190 [Trema orientale]